MKEEQDSMRVRILSTKEKWISWIGTGGGGVGRAKGEEKG